MITYIGEIVVDVIVTVAPGDVIGLYITDATTGLIIDISGASLAISSIGGVQGATGVQGPTGPVGFLTSEYIQLGVTGVTGTTVGGRGTFLGSVNGSSGCGMVFWQQQNLQAGGLVQAGNQGTSSAYVNVTNGGIYDISYTITPTGGQPIAGGFTYIIEQRLNATGTSFSSGGTPIAASKTLFIGPNSNAVSNRYIAAIPAGANIETWITPIANNGGNAGQSGFILSATGTQFSMNRIA